MARPRVFVSSTYYDLKHIRASLANFIQSLGFDTILSEKGDVAYAHDIPLDESCYREVASADLFVMIVGGRYGSPTSADRKKLDQNPLADYDSVTKQELAEAIAKNIPVFILVETAVDAEFRTYLRNKGKDISFAHVDSPHVFVMLEHILSLQRNNPKHTFERFADIEAWLREQWAGLFQDLLNRKSSQPQLKALAEQITSLQQVNETLKSYMEFFMTKEYPQESATLLDKEKKRLRSRLTQRIAESAVGGFIVREFGIAPDTLYDCLVQNDSYEEFVEWLKQRIVVKPGPGDTSLYDVAIMPAFLDDVSTLRTMLGLSPYRKDDDRNLLRSLEDKSPLGPTSRSRSSEKKESGLASAIKSGHALRSVDDDSPPPNR